MLLEINKSYNLFTKKNTITYKKVKVLGVLNYDEASNLPDSIYQLAINEAVIDADDTAQYLEKQVYYKLLVLDGTNTIITAWDDIIDFDVTTELNVEFTLQTTAKIASSSNVSIDDVKKAIDLHLKERFGGDVESKTVILNVIGNDGQAVNSVNADKDKLAAFEEMLNKSYDVLESVVRLQNKADNVYTKLDKLSVVSNLDTLQEKTANIESSVKEIWQLLQ